MKRMSKYDREIVTMWTTLLIGAAGFIDLFVRFDEYTTEYAVVMSVIFMLPLMIGGLIAAGQIMYYIDRQAHQAKVRRYEGQKRAREQGKFDA